MRPRTLVLVGAALAAVSLGLPWRSVAGTDSGARFFIVAAIALALVGGLYPARPQVLRWAAYAGIAGIALYAGLALTGGTLALFAAALCFWLAGRLTPEESLRPGG